MCERQEERESLYMYINVFVGACTERCNLDVCVYVCVCVCVCVCTTRV